jgi:energy-coupling factor transporter ATP-binding protein EcfA2
VSSPLLRMENVSYRYPEASERALAEVSLEIHAGEFCLLAGLSGHGKSTLLRAACGLVPHFHGGTIAGHVVLAGMDTREHGPAQLGEVAGVLFQDPESQLVMSTVRAELALPLESRGQPAAAVARGVEEVALALGIDALLDRSTNDLSGGEKQRVALGAALAGRPRIVLLDEPTSQLDPVAGDELIGLLRRLNQEWETTIVLAEHRLERALHAADRVISMHAGRIACDGDPQAFLAWALSSAPALATPAARLFSLAQLEPVPTGVRQARAALRARGLLREADARSEDTGPPHADARPSRRRAIVRRRGRGRADAALRASGLWHELRDGPAILRGVDLIVAPGESVALMGRNGAGKSTLLRHLAGLLEPTRGSVVASGRVALLLQNPGDYFIHERVADEAPAAALARAGLAHLSQRNPRDLSGGERQRLALAIVTAGTDEGAAVEQGQAGERPAVLALDEPTRGMDRAAKADLAHELHARLQQGTAVIVATHDPEFAAACADRAVLLADGRVIADGPTPELLAGGWYFATETARILGGAGGALLPEQGAALIAPEASAAAAHAALRDGAPIGPATANGAER